MSIPRAICGDCPTCRPITLRVLRAGAPARLLPGDTPTAAALERHAQRYGPEQVAETAAQYRIAVAVARDKKERKASGPSLRKRVAGYVADGYGADVVAELENLTPSRARRLVAEAEGKHGL